MRRRALITGGAGFIGSNLAARLLESGDRVVLVDDLSRPHVERNARWLERRFPGRVELRVADVRDRAAMTDAVRGVDRVFHFAAQVAVTTSLVAPLDDLDVNARGTLTVLECVRALTRPPPLVFTSTNKVYGALPDVVLARRERRYEPVDQDLRAHGVGESRPLDFHSPYGCSKGAADQYVLDYARTFGLPTTVFRMSCIYGPRQFGNEEQGWVAHFVRAAMRGETITIFGDGLQVRDVLFVDDLVDALVAASEAGARSAGRVFNLGGGPERTLSLLELLDRLRDDLGLRCRVRFAAPRPGDQRYYVSDVRAAAEALGVRPRTDVATGLAALHRWLSREMEPTARGAASADGASPP